MYIVMYVFLPGIMLAPSGGGDGGLEGGSLPESLLEFSS